MTQEKKDYICNECNDHLDYKECYCDICWGTKIQIIKELQSQLSEARGLLDVPVKVVVEEASRTLKLAMECSGMFDKGEKEYYDNLAKAIEVLKKS